MNHSKFFFHRNAGQSLVEFVICVPIFFILLSGINLFFNQYIKKISEESAHDNLLISDSNFQLTERKIAFWNNTKLNPFEYNNQILDYSFNSSQFFKSVETEKGIFMDKKRVIQSNCTENPSFLLKNSQFGEFKFQSCSDEKGFEARNFIYDDKTYYKKFQNMKNEYQGKSIYYPFQSLEWNKRNSLVSKAIHHFNANIHSTSFKSEYASLSFPQDKGQFNTTCLMSPYTPLCTIPPLGGKWRRAAFDGANTQIFECLAEASTRCLKFIAPQAIAGCVIKQTGEIGTALAIGKKASACPILNQIVELMQKKVLFTAKTYQKIQQVQEANHRKSVFSP